ncbi:MAG: DUF1304 domain-containing protein [Bacteroidota bacterium]
MKIAAQVLIALVAFLHLYFLYFEMFAWTSLGPKVFRKFPKDLFEPTKSMAANQGLYNGFLSAGLIWSFFISDPIWQKNVAYFFLGCVAVAGIYGALSVSKRIFTIQALPALIAMLLVYLY